MMGSRNPGFRDMARKRKRIVWELKKDWKVSYDGTWRRIMEEVSEEVGIPVGDVERINTAWWKFFSEMLCRVEMPEIRMEYFCTIRPSVAKLYSYCEKMSRLIELIASGRVRDKDRIGDVGGMRKHLARLQDTYFRLAEEKSKPKGERMSEEDIAERDERTVVPKVNILELEKIKKDRNDKQK